MGIITDTDNTPIQEVSVITSSGYLDIQLTTNQYKANLSEETILSGTGIVLSGLEGLSKLGGSILKAEGKNCKNLVDTYGKLIDGEYTIQPEGYSPFTVYCDMTTDGGGWTLVQHGTDNDIIKYDTRGDSSWLVGTTTIDYSSIDESFKYSDAMINTIRSGGIYMLKGQNNVGSNTWYTKSTCDYQHNLGANGECSKLYEDVNFASAKSCATNVGWRGIGCWGGIITRHSSAANIVCFYASPGGGRCTNSTWEMSVKMFVR